MAVFELSFLNEMHRRFRRLPPFQRPFIANIALENERAEERARIDGWIRRLEEDDQQRLVPLLRHPNHFIHAYSELAVAQVLLDSGFETRYEQSFEGLTPHWSCRHGSDAFVCEVFTAGLPDARQEAAAMQLAGRLSSIPQPFLIRLDVPPDFALDSGEQKKRCAEVAAWLADGAQTGDDWANGGITVTVLGPSRDRVEVIVTDDAYFTPTPASIAAEIHTRSQKYAAVALPFLIAVVKHPRAEADVVTFQDGVLGTASYRRVARSDGRVVSALWRQAGGGFDGRRELSAALWLHPYRAGGSERLLLTNPESSRPLPQAAVRRLETAG